MKSPRKVYITGSDQQTDQMIEAVQWYTLKHWWNQWQIITDDRNEISAEVIHRCDAMNIPVSVISAEGNVGLGFLLANKQVDKVLILQKHKQCGREEIIARMCKKRGIEVMQHIFGE